MDARVDEVAAVYGVGIIHALLGEHVGRCAAVGCSARIVRIGCGREQWKARLPVPFVTLKSNAPLTDPCTRAIFTAATPVVSIQTTFCVLIKARSSSDESLERWP